MIIAFTRKQRAAMPSATQYTGLLELAYFEAF
jgi:hypothetical protein